MYIKFISKFIDTNYLFYFIKCHLHSKNYRFIIILFSPKFKLFYGRGLRKITRSLDSWLDIFLFGLLKGYKTFFDIRGTGYKVRLISTLELYGIILRMGYSHLIYMGLFQYFRASFFTRLGLNLFSSDLWLLHNKVQSVTVQKKINAYKGKGIFWKGSVFKLKKSTKLRF